MADQVTKKDLDALRKDIDKLRKDFDEEKKRSDAWCAAVTTSANQMNKQVADNGRAGNELIKQVDALAAAVAKLQG